MPPPRSTAEMEGSKSCKRPCFWGRASEKQVRGAGVRGAAAGAAGAAGDEHFCGAFFGRLLVLPGVPAMLTWCHPTRSYLFQSFSCHNPTPQQNKSFCICIGVDPTDLRQISSPGLFLPRAFAMSTNWFVFEVSAPASGVLWWPHPFRAKKDSRKRVVC